MLVFTDQPTALKPYSIGELALIYQVDYRTLKKWMKPFSGQLGDRIGRYYSITQVEIIFLHLKVPSKITVKPVDSKDYTHSNKNTSLGSDRQHPK